MAAPQFNVWQFSAPDRNIGASSAPLPCSGGDLITFTASIRYVSGGMQPYVGVFFWDALQETSYGVLLIAPPNTDSGWHNYSFTCQVPAGASTMTVATTCAYVGSIGEISAQLTADVYPGENVTCLVNNTTNMAVGSQVNISELSGGGGGGISQIVPVLSVDSGVSFNANINYHFRPGSNVVNAYPPGTTYFVGFLPSGAIPLTGTASQTAWEVSNYRLSWTPAGTSTPIALYAPLTDFAITSNFTYDQTQEFIFPLYYLSLITSEYQSAPNLYAWLSTLLTPLIDLIACTQQMYQSFALPSTAAALGFLNVAQGSQLDIIGQIVGIKRTLPFQPGVNTTTTEAITVTGSQTVTVAGLNPPGAMGTSGMAVGGGVSIGGASPENVTITAFVPGVSFTATFAHTHITGVTVTSTTPPSAVLSDADYVTLLTAKIAQNQWNGLTSSIYQLLNSLFPGSGILIEDGGLTGSVMTATVVLPGGTLTPMQEQMVVAGLILPRPQAVLYIFEYANLPLFGLDLETAFVAGLDTGYLI